MRNLKKITAFLMAVFMVFALFGCSSLPRTANKEWAYRANGKDYAVGTYLLALSDAYESCYAYLYNTAEDFDPDKSILDMKASFDETGEIYSVRDWIKMQAEDFIRYMVAVDGLADKHGVVIGADAKENAMQQAKAEWFMGDIEGEMSGYSIAYPMKDKYEPIGISLDSFFSAKYMLNNKYDATFTRLYTTGGEREVPKKEVSDYFETNYTHYYYFIADLYDNVVDEVTGETVNTPFDAKKTAAYKEKLESYIKLVAAGATTTQISDDYKSYAGIVGGDMFVENTETYESLETSISVEVADVVRNMKESSAEVIYMGQETTPIALFIYKAPISEVTKEYIGDDVKYKSIVSELRGQEFFDYLAEYAEELEFEINWDYINKFTLELIEDNYNRYLDSVE